MATHRSEVNRFRRPAVGLAILGLLLAATFSGTAQARMSGHRASATPAYGGGYALRFPDAPDCLDPQKTATSASATVDGYVFDTLLSVDTKGHYVGNLATKYKVSNGGTRLTFFLRKGVRFSNGDPFNAQAVKFTFNRAVDPATKSPVTAGFLSQVSNTKVINKYTVELDLKSAFRPLLTNLASVETGILDPKATRAQGTNSCQKPVGTGPYKLQSVAPDFSTVTVAANKYHNFGPSWVQNKGKPYITTVRFKTITSDSTAVSDLLAGGLDLMNIPGTQLSRVQGNKSFVIHKTQAQSLIFLEFNTAHPPFNNLAVRKAVEQLIDRQAIIKAALNGLGHAVYGSLPKTLPYFDKTVAKLMPPLDPGNAAKVIAANNATGPYTMLVPAIPTYQTIAEIVQAAAAQAGMKLNINSQPLSSFVPTAGKGDFDILTLDYNYTDPDVLYFLLHSSQGKGAGLNWTNDTNPQLDTLLVRGRTTLNNKKAAGIYAQIQTLINKQLVFVGLVNPVSEVGIRRTIKGYHTNSLGATGIQDLYSKTR